MADVGIDDGKQAPVAFRGGGFEPAPRQWVSWLFFAGVICAWQAVSDAGLINPLFLPSPLQIAIALKELAASGELARHFAASLVRIGIGWIVGTAAGVLFGTLIGLFWVWRS